MLASTNGLFYLNALINVHRESFTLYESETTNRPYIRRSPSIAIIRGVISLSLIGWSALGMPTAVLDIVFLWPLIDNAVGMFVERRQYLDFLRLNREQMLALPNVDEIDEEYLMGKRSYFLNYLAISPVFVMTFSTWISFSFFAMVVIVFLGIITIDQILLHRKPDRQIPFEMDDRRFYSLALQGGDLLSLRLLCAFIMLGLLGLISEPLMALPPVGVNTCLGGLGAILYFVVLYWMIKWVRWARKELKSFDNRKAMAVWEIDVRDDPETETTV